MGNVAPAPVTVNCAEAGAGALVFAEAIDPEGALVAGNTLPAGLADEPVHAETMSTKITRMSPGQGLTANLVTAFLVSCASRFGLPVSTTHVSVGALFGKDLTAFDAQTGKPRWSFTTEGGSGIPAPVFGDGLLFVPGSELVALKPGGPSNKQLDTNANALVMVFIPSLSLFGCGNPAEDD